MFSLCAFSKAPFDYQDHRVGTRLDEVGRTFAIRKPSKRASLICHALSGQLRRVATSGRDCCRYARVIER
jgi:hypothetical protein